jgi:nitrite reductase/ring-hydroxylating ferredoxin subunit
MERRNVLALAVSAAVGAVVAACGGTPKAAKVTLPPATSSTTTKVTLRTTTTAKAKSGTTTTTTPTTTTSGGLTPVTTTPPTTTAPAPSTTIPAKTWPAIARASDLPVGSTFVFTFGDSSTMAGQQGILYRASATKVDAVSAVCTHAGGPCVPAGGTLVQCQWHGSQFNVTDGAVERGPATYPLAMARCEIRPDGYVYWVADL